MCSKGALSLALCPGQVMWLRGTAGAGGSGAGRAPGPPAGPPASPRGQRGCSAQHRSEKCHPAELLTNLLVASNSGEYSG